MGPQAETAQAEVLARAREIVFVERVLHKGDEFPVLAKLKTCLLYTSDAADERVRV